MRCPKLIVIPSQPVTPASPVLACWGREARDLQLAGRAGVLQTPRSFSPAAADGSE